MNISQPMPPIAIKHPVATTHHGQNRSDDYAWMRDVNWREVMREPSRLNADIRANLEAENAYWEHVMARDKARVAELFAEMKARIKEDDSSVPLVDGAWAYFRRYREGGQHPIFCRQPRNGGLEAILLDGDHEAAGQTFFRIAGCVHSPDHRILAYAVDLKGSEIFSINFRNMQTGDNLPDILDGVGGGFEWANDSRTMFYVVLDDEHRPYAVRQHLLGDKSSTDITVYEEASPGFFVGLGKTESRRFLTINAHDHQTSEVHLLDADTPGEPELVAAREVGHEYDVTDHGERLLIRTNADNAEDFKIVSAPPKAQSRSEWCDLVPHQPGRLILDLQVFSDFVVRLERVDGLPQIVVVHGDEEHCIAFDEEPYHLELVGNYEYQTAVMRFTYSSMSTPERVYDYDMVNHQRKLRKQQEVPSGHDSADYVSRRIQALAADGETVPVSLLYRRETPLDGSAPVLLYGYGAYGYSMPAAFLTARLSLVDHGFIYAVAHVRGGMEKGYKWYQQGRGVNKLNTFSDFIAVAEGLISIGIASPGRIAAQGGSAGGMLMGAVANMRPELFRAIVAQVPFVDVLNTMLDASLPLTPPEWPEWGNPINDAEAYRTIATYSPYDNVTAQDYPNIYVTAGLTDPRVTYWEPAKWVARLRAIKTDDNTLCFKTNMQAGHAGAAGRFDSLEEVAESYAFLLRVFGGR